MSADDFRDPVVKLVHLVVFLAKNVVGARKCRDEAIRMESPQDLLDHLVMRFPIIAGSRQRWAIEELAEREYNSKLAGEAVELIKERERSNGSD